MGKANIYRTVGGKPLRRKTLGTYAEKEGYY
jgi:hypothetical protein